MLKSDPSQLVDNLSERYVITRTNIKQGTVGSPIQAPLDALVGFLKQLSITADDVRKVVVQKVVVRPASDEVDAVKNCEMPDICLRDLVALMLLEKTVTFASIS